MFCFFKQRTAYEMRIMYWSSDVCSSDLQQLGRQRGSEAVVGGVGAGNVGGDHAEEAVAEEEHEGRRAVYHARLDDLAAAPEAFVAVVAGAGLAAGDQRTAVGAMKGPARPASGRASCRESGGQDG